ncbi:MAG TPA: site-specific integrase [Roseiarcus sp.]|nr:site-specific integrase [Roseiarcus sp.]
MRKSLTDVYVRTVAPPPSGRLEVSDLRCVGLTFRVTKNGAKTWSLRFRDLRSGVLTRATIGNYPEVSLHSARERALNLRREIAAGVNPVEKKRIERDEASTRTFEALAERYMTEHALRHKRTAEADQRNLDLHVLPHWRKRRFDRIGRSDVIALCESVVAKGSPIQANRVQALLSKIFSFALDAELVTANPCARLKKRSKETTATRVLSDNEIRLFWRRVGDPPNSARIGQALRLAMLTGVRVTELAGAELKEFERLDDPENATWTIPAARSKNGKAHVVPLGRLALSIVSDLVKRAKPHENMADRFLFASPNHPSRPIDGHALSVAMIRFGNTLRAATDTKDRLSDEVRAITTWTSQRPCAHDLRRTFATRLAASSVPSEDVSACLNHTRTSVTARHYDLYDRAREKRRAFNLWAEEIAMIVGESNRSVEVKG